MHRAGLSPPPPGGGAQLAGGSAALRPGSGAGAGGEESARCRAAARPAPPAPRAARVLLPGDGRAESHHVRFGAPLPPPRLVSGQGQPVLFTFSPPPLTAPLF